jgi:putative flippase GtrA
MPRMVSLRKRFADLIPELAKFGVVGLIGSVVDLGGAAYLHGAVGIGPMVSKGLSITAATVVTYLGSRFWTFRHRVNQALLREGILFAALNLVGLAIAECVIALITYGLDMKGTLAYNAASVVGTGFGTIFRYFSYKKWVFLAGAPGAAVAAGEAAVSGIVDATETSETGAVRAGTVPAGTVPAGTVDGHRGSYHGYHPSHGRTPAHRHTPAHGPRYEASPAPGHEPSAERGYGPPWELLDAADAPRR